MACVLRLCVGIAASVSAQTGPAIPSDEEITRTIGRPFYSGRIIPTPKQVTYGEGYVVLFDGPGRTAVYEPMIEYPGPARELLIRLFNNRVEAYKRQFPGDWRLPDKSRRLPMLFALASDGAAGALLDRYGLCNASAALKPQGYLLEVRPDGVLCAGKDNQGLVNGLASLLQLMHVKDGRLVLRRASINDAPTFTTRHTAEYSLGDADFFDWMVLYKYNGFASCYPAMSWRGLSESQKNAMKVIREYVERYRTMSYMVQFHIGGRREVPVDCGNPDDVARLLATITETIELSGARHIMLCYDDVVPQLQPHEQEKFERPAQAHGAVIDRVYQHVRQIRPDAIISFCTPYYQGFQHRRWRADAEHRQESLRYLEDTRAWNPNVRLVWTGPVTESRFITDEDIDLYRRVIGRDRPLFYWDNTWHYHQPLRDFHSKYPKDFVRQCADSTSYININGTTPIGRFFAATAVDYYWNPDAFDSRQTRQQAVAQFMGPAAVSVAERFYAFRGDGYISDFSKTADLRVFDAILRNLENVSWDPAIPAACRAGYDRMAEIQKKLQE